MVFNPGLALVFTWIVLLSMPCNAQLEEQSRRIVFMNRSGGPVDLYQNYPAKDQQELEKESIEDGAGFATFGSANQEFEIVNACKDKECPRVLYQVGQAHNGKEISSIVTIEEELDISVEDFVARNKPVSKADRTEFEELYPGTLRLNSDVSLFPQIDSITHRYQLDKRILSWQRKKLRDTPTVGFIENKIFQQSLLAAMGIPIAEIYYAAFSTKSMGKFPMYNRTEFIRTMMHIPQVYEQHHFVAKSPTMFGSNGLVLMNNDKWEENELSLPWLANQIERFFEWESRAGMKYDHRGIIVQANILPAHVTTDKRMASFDEFFYAEKVPVFELKMHVVFGKLCSGRIQTTPLKYQSFIDITFCGGGEPSFVFASGFNGAIPELWDITRPIISNNTEKIAAIAEEVAYTFGLDVFRLDVLMDGNGLFIVNEVTYPSFLIFEHDCANTRLLDAYKMAKFDILNPTSVLESVLERVDVPYDDFVNATDYYSLEHSDEHEYARTNYYFEQDFDIWHPLFEFGPGVYHDDLDKDVCVSRTAGDFWST